MKILKNAIESIQIGLEDFKNNDPRRSYSALRNIFAGTLLLFKEKLRRLSPNDSDEVLIKQKIVPKIDGNQQLSFVGKGGKTVDVFQIEERFKEFNIIVDWKAFKEINVLRNDIEHYYTEKSPAIINEIVSKAFKIINDFCIKYLEEDPAQLFGKQYWSIFLEAEELYKIEKQKSVDSLSRVNWTFKIFENAVNNIRCPHCLSDLIYIKDVLKYEAGEFFPLTCNECKLDFDLEDVIEEYVIEELAGENHIAGMEGSDGPYTTCPECTKACYIYNEGCCIACGYQQQNRVCLVCSSQLDLEEAYDGELCSYHRYNMEKDD